MGKRGGRKAFPSAYNASRVHVLRTPNPDVVASYAEAVKTTTGPKNNLEPVLDNSFTRPVRDGVAGRLRCTECGRKFYTTIQWAQHLKGKSSDERLLHEQVFEPDLKKYHYDLDDGAYRPHALMPTPRNVTIWQSKMRQGATTWRWLKVSSTRKETVRLGFNGDKWKFSKELPSGDITHYSHPYESKEQAMLFFNSSRILWVVTK
jgi:hypothetical protein